MKLDTNDAAQAELLERYVDARRGETTRPAALEAALAAVADDHATVGPDAGYVERLRQRLAHEGGTALLPSRPARWRWLPAWTEGRLRAASFAMTAVLIVAVGMVFAWERDLVLGEGQPPSGVARPVEFLSLAQAQAAVIFPLLTAPEGYAEDWVRWYCVTFGDRPCSPQAAWVETRFVDGHGHAVVLKQGYFGTIAGGSVAAMLPADRKGAIDIGGRQGSWIDCRGEAGARACKTGGRADGTYDNYAAHNQLAAIGWLVSTDGGSQRSVSIESESLSPAELAALGAGLQPVAQAGQGG